MKAGNISNATVLDLDVRRRIDVVCDRFEQEWSDHHRPRIENFLELVRPAEQHFLFRELLALEIALRTARKENCSYTEYAKRFPTWASTVAEVCAQRDRTAAPESVENFRLTCLTIAEAFRNRKRNRLGKCEITVSEQNWLHETLTSHRPGEQPARDLAVDQQLWLSLFNVGWVTEISDLAGFELLTADLFDAFSPLRQSIIEDILLGCKLKDVARVYRISERTVIATLQAAMELLATS